MLDVLDVARGSRVVLVDEEDEGPGWVGAVEIEVATPVVGVVGVVDVARATVVAVVVVPLGTGVVGGVVM